MKKKYIAGLMVLSFATSLVKAQDVHFSQINESQMFLSPSNTGFFNGYVRATANYRNQWASMGKAFQTEAIAIDGGLFRSKKRSAFMGVGLTIFNDVAGAGRLRQTNILLNVSGLVKLGRHSALSAGLAGGTTGMNANYSGLTYESQFNGNYLNTSLSSGEAIYRQSTVLDVGAGLTYEFSTASKDQDHDDLRSVRISVAAYHLNKAVQDFGPGSSYRMPVRYTAAVYTNFEIEDTHFSISPTVVFHSQDKYQELTLGSNFRYRMTSGTKFTGTKTTNAIGLGLYYRRNDALIPMLTYDMGDYSVGVSYDVNLSAYRSASRYHGGLELSLRYNSLASSLFESRREYR